MDRPSRHTSSRRPVVRIDPFSTRKGLKPVRRRLFSFKPAVLRRMGWNRYGTTGAQTVARVRRAKGAMVGGGRRFESVRGLCEVTANQLPLFAREATILDPGVPRTP